MVGNRRYMKAVMENDLPEIAEEERIYLKVRYNNRQFAQTCQCGFDDERKLWFTGIKNSNLYALIRLYGLHDATSDEMKERVNKLLAGSEKDSK